MSEGDTLSATLDRSTRLSVARTRLSYERTLMSWLRTSASLISFGFTIYKFFQFDMNYRDTGRLVGPREFSIALIAIGLGSLFVAVIQHRQNMERMRAEYGGVLLPNSMAAIVAGVFSVLGIVALLVVLFRQ